MIPRLVEKLKSESDDTILVCTRDTHYRDYLDTPEGKMLPIEHCIKDSEGWKIADELNEVLPYHFTIDKRTFGAVNLANWIRSQADGVTEIEFVGLCTDICVVTNALLMKTAFYDTDVDITCDATCCAGTTPENHEAALKVMKSCQIIVKE